MKVSVLVPVYGVERYIGACAESLFGQTFSDIEYIFVDDCTPDRSIAVLQEVLSRYPERQQQVRILRHEQNKGLGAARLTALRAATSDYLLHVDSDDLIPLDAVEKLYRAIAGTALDIVDGGYQEYRQGQMTETVLPVGYSTETYLKILLCRSLLPNPIWGRIYRRALFFEHDVLPVEGIDNSEDYLIITRLLFYARRGYINDVVYYYRNDNPQSYTHQLSEKNCRSALRAGQVVYDFYQQHDSESRYGHALNFSMLNLLRFSREQTVGVRAFLDSCHYQPSGWAYRCVFAMLRSRMPLCVGAFVLRSMRRLYAEWLKLFVG